MTIRPKKLSWNSRIRAARGRRLRDRGRRDLRLEPLEDRRLMAVGPQLAGIQPNDGSLLTDGQVRNVAPVDLTFRFSEPIDASTLSGIRITRSGLDGQFDRAQATTDFNTTGAVVMDFVAVDPALHGQWHPVGIHQESAGCGRGAAHFGGGQEHPCGVEQRRLAVRRVRFNCAMRSTTIRGQDADHDVDSCRQQHEHEHCTTPAITYSPVVLTGANCLVGGVQFQCRPIVGDRVYCPAAGDGRTGHRDCGDAARSGWRQSAGGPGRRTRSSRWNSTPTRPVRRRPKSW